MDENNCTNEINKGENIQNTDELKDLFSKQFEKLRTQSMLVGAQAICTTILQKVLLWRKPNISRRDLERICKDIEQFCRTSLYRKVNEDGTIYSTEADEDNTNSPNKNNEE